MDNKKSSVKKLMEPTSDSRFVSIGEAFEIAGGYSATRDDLGGKGICYLHYGDIHSSTKTIIDVPREVARLPKLDVPLSYVNKSSLLRNGDVVFVDASEDVEGASKFTTIRNPEQIPYIAGLHTIVAHPQTDLFDKLFLSYLFLAPYVRQQFAHYAAGTKVCGINKTSIKRISLPCPPIEEQKKIASILLSIDNVIPQLHNKLSKVVKLKQGLMSHFFG